MQDLGRDPGAAAEPGDASPGEEADGARESWWPILRDVFAWVWPVGLAVWIFRGWGLLGYNPTDDGFVLGQSQRLLRGEIPHADFISARPVGSPLFHTIDILLPTPLEATSRFITIGEVVLYTICFAAIIFGCWPRRFAAWQIPATTAAVLVNLHVFPIMPWHTIDGLTFTAAGFAVLLVRKDELSARRAMLGMGLLGFAALTKQSFFPAPVLGLFLLVHFHRAPWRQQVRWMIKPVAVGIAPGLLYAFVVTVGGGLGSFREQLTGGPSTYGEQLLTTYGQPLDARRLMQHIVLVMVLLAVTRLLMRTRTPLGVVIAIIPRIWVTLVVLDSVRHGALVSGGFWGLELWWTLVAVLVFELWADRELDIPLFLIGATGWMTMLSWGYAFPNLVGGTIALAIIARIWRDGVQLPTIAKPLEWAVPIVIALMAFSNTAKDFRGGRDGTVYRDAAKPGLTMELSPISNDLKGIKTNPGTFEYLRQLKQCVDDHPASRVALLPDNAGLYPILGLHNPFPMDWGYYFELVDDAEKKMVEAARKLDERGDYLVVFETAGHEAALVPGTQPPASVPLTTPVFRYSNSGQEIFDTLTGEKISCGTFIAIYKPKAASEKRLVAGAATFVEAIELPARSLIAGLSGGV